MRIGILTHPFKGNYGGMLQAFALHKVIRQLHHEPTLIQYLNDYHQSIITHIRTTLSRSLVKLCRCCKIHFMATNFAATHIESFEYIPRHTENTKIQDIDLFIVGSDQVWRCEYVRHLSTVPFFFLDFAPESLRRKSISYAASFGSDQWEGTLEETAICKELIQQFKAVSVREHSGISLCKDIFDTPSVQMPDPTLLLHAADYEQIIRKEKTKGLKQAFIASYLLDEDKEKYNSLQHIAGELNMPYQHLMPHSTSRNRRDRFTNSVAQWLRYFRDAEFIVTDSFHGCVFSIIFNKPFICLENQARGLARFVSLLETFELRDRLLSQTEDSAITNLIHTPIDWARVTSIHESERARGIQFLRDNLK